MQFDWIVGWIAEDNHTADSNIQRFRDNNELLFCLRSIHKFAPFINKIHIILGRDSSPPAWLTNHAKINLVNESSLYSPVQPNSETKKLFYHEIPDIAEYFFTSDDDMFLVDNIDMSDCLSKTVPILNSVGFCIARSRKKYWDGSGHLPLIWKRRHYHLAVNRLNQKLYKEAGTKRYNPWIEMKRYLLTRNLVTKGCLYRPRLFVNNTNVKNLEHVFSDFLSKYFFSPTTATTTRNKYICINDDFDRNSHLTYQKQYQYMQTFLLILYPEKAPWEDNEINPNKFEVTHRPTFTVEKIFGRSLKSTKTIRMSRRLPEEVKISFATKVTSNTDQFSYKVDGNLITITRTDQPTGWNFNHSFIMIISA